MLDIKFAREKPEKVVEALEKRNYDSSVFDDFLKNEKERKVLFEAVQHHRQNMNEITSQIDIRRKQGQDTADLKSKAKDLSDTIKNQEASLNKYEEKVNNALLIIPNIPHSTVPEGKTSDDNVEIRKCNEPPKFTFTPRDHSEIGVNLGIRGFGQHIFEVKGVVFEIV